ncbi:hypothetical protein PAMA_000290 [Pampus argenteus]
MGDTGSEGSKPPSNVNVIPPRCPCGFWGSSKTMNLCSKCFADIQKKQPDDDCAPKASSSSSSSQADIFCNESNSSISQSLMSMSNTSEEPLPGETGVTSLPAQDVSSTDTVFSSLSTPTKRSYESVSESESDVSPDKRARVGELPEGDESSSLSLSASSSSSSSRSGSKQRSRKRCHRCQTKLELVQQELGSCRCEVNQWI